MLAWFRTHASTRAKIVVNNLLEEIVRGRDYLDITAPTPKLTHPYKILNWEYCMQLYSGAVRSETIPLGVPSFVLLSGNNHRTLFGSRTTVKVRASVGAFRQVSCSISSGSIGNTVVTVGVTTNVVPGLIEGLRDIASDEPERHTRRYMAANGWLLMY